MKKDRAFPSYGNQSEGGMKVYLALRTSTREEIWEGLNKGRIWHFITTERPLGSLILASFLNLCFVKEPYSTQWIYLQVIPAITVRWSWCLVKIFLVEEFIVVV